MLRGISSTACIAAMFCLTVVPIAPAWAAAKPTGGPSEAAPASMPAGTVKPPVAAQTDFFAPTAQLVSVHFDFDRSVIRPGDAARLDKNAAWLKANPGKVVLVEAAADQRGIPAYNLALGNRRAKAVKDYLVAQGIAPERIMTITYGKGRLACPTNADTCWSDNRRVDFQVKVMNKQAP